MATFSNKPETHYSARTAHGIKGRQSIFLTHNLSTIDANQTPTVRFPNLRADDVIIPGTMCLAFNVTLNGGADANRTMLTTSGGRS